MTPDYSDSNPALAGLYKAHLDILARRHDRALERAGAHHAIIYSGNPRLVFLDDYHYPFKANPHFTSWAPLTNLPFSYIIYTPGEKPILVYYQPHDYWHVVPGAPSGYWTAAFDIRVVHSTDEVPLHLPEARDQCIAIGEFHDASLAFGIDRINPTTAINVLHFARGNKTAYEIELLRLSSRRAATGHIAAREAFREGAPEFEIHRAYCRAVSHTDNELPYGNIVALNEHSAILHYTNLDRVAPQEIRSFLIDAGAQVHGYAADITRTYSYKSRRFQDLIDRMESMEQAIVADVRAGLDYKDLHVGTHARIAEIMIEIELAKGSPASLVESGVTAAFFPHGLGHLLGVQVHDVGGFMENDSGATLDKPTGHPYLRLTRRLEEDMVLTIEPGLYIIDMLLDELRDSLAGKMVNWKTVEWLRPFGGIRIEDNVRVLADGCENLTRDAFTALRPSSAP